MEVQAEIIRQSTNAASRVLLLAECEGAAVGFVGGTGGMVKRNRHTLQIAIGVLQRYWRRGVATRLLQALLTWARLHDFVRVELTAMKHNDAAVSLYKKFGFEVEGSRRAALNVDGHFVDEWYMAKLLPTSDCVE